MSAATLGLPAIGTGAMFIAVGGRAAGAVLGRAPDAAAVAARYSCWNLSHALLSSSSVGHWASSAGLTSRSIPPLLGGGRSSSPPGGCAPPAAAAGAGVPAGRSPWTALLDDACCCCVGATVCTTVAVGAIFSNGMRGMLTDGLLLVRLLLSLLRLDLAEINSSRCSSNSRWCAIA